MYRHICLNVRGALAQDDRELRSWVGNIEHDGVKCRNVREVRQFLIEALGEGCEYLVPAECDNYDPKKGCLGHPCEEETENERGYQPSNDKALGKSP